jgi:hypothetical protein
MIGKKILLNLALEWKLRDKCIVGRDKTKNQSNLIVTINYYSLLVSLRLSIV